MAVRAARTLPGDWYPGVVPPEAHLDETAYVETTYSFSRCRSRARPSVSMAEASSAYQGTMFDLGAAATVRVGRYTLLNGVRFICDSSVVVGDYCLLSWNVVIMDTYRAPRDPARRRAQLLRREEPGAEEARPVLIGDNVWIGLDACVLPGVTVGEGSVVAARAVVADDVPPYTVVAGNPSRIVRHLGGEPLSP